MTTRRKPAPKLKPLPSGIGIRFGCPKLLSQIFPANVHVYAKQRPEVYAKQRPE
jgi:hypothetical protein